MKKVIRGFDKPTEAKTSNNYINKKDDSDPSILQKIQSADRPSWWDDPGYDMSGRRIPEPVEAPEDEGYLYLYVDDVIVVRDNGDWDFEDTGNESQKWARGDTRWGDHEIDMDDYTIVVRDWAGAIEDAAQVIDDKIVNAEHLKPGMYHLDCELELVYSISGVDVYKSFGKYEEDYEEHYSVDYADVEFNLPASKANDVKLTPLSTHAVE